MGPGRYNLGRQTDALVSWPSPLLTPEGPRYGSLWDEGLQVALGALLGRCPLRAHLGQTAGQTSPIADTSAVFL